MLNASADLLHLDVMDGTLVPNISFGFSVIDPLSKIAEKPMDAHLMVVEPQRWFRKLSSDGVGWCSFHLEAAGERTGAFIEEIQSLGMKAGVAVNPDVPIENLFPYIGKADFFLVMSVFAGFGGQKFIPDALPRVAALKAEIDRRGAKAEIEIDGGINLDNVRSVKEAGATMIVAGSTVFRSENPAATIAALRDA